MSDLDNLEKRVAIIEARNQRVELEKSWEVGLERKILLAITTYLTMWLFMATIHVEKAWLNAVIPTLGFLLSTLSLGFFKRIWLKNQPKDLK